MRFYGYHGVSPAEKELAGRYAVDVDVNFDTAPAAASDSLKDTVNYEQVYREVEQIITSNQFHLVETIAERIAEHLYRRLGVDGLRVRVRKEQPPFPGHLDYIEIETTRGRI